ncbi:MAG: IS1380 family transposase [Actinomycetota bacterium]
MAADKSKSSPRTGGISKVSINPLPPVVQVSTTNREITAHAGAVLIRQVIRAIGLVEAVKRNLHVKKRSRGLNEGQFIASMAEAVAMGAGCLDDLAIARADKVQKKLRGFAVPAPQTAGAFLRRFTLGHVGQFNKALRSVHRTAFQLLGEIKQLTLDFDSTYIRSRSSRRQGADATWLKRYALHPLMCFVAEYGVCLHVKLRRGKANTSKGIVPFVDECLRRMPDGVPIRARFDSGFHSDKLLCDLQARGVTYLCAVPVTQRITGVIRRIDEISWSDCQDDKVGQVAEFGYRLSKSKVFRRHVVKRIAKKPGEQLDLETGGYHYWILVTNDHETGAAVLESEHRHKAQVEAGMRELKENFGLEVLRKHAFYANWTWILIVVTAHNLLRWTQLIGDLEPKGDLRAKRLRYRYLSVPAMLVCSGRRLNLKLRRDYPLLEGFLSALAQLKALPSPAT